MKNILKNLIISIVFLFILFGQKNVINVNASENSDIIINAIQNEIMDYSKDAVDKKVDDFTIIAKQTYNECDLIDVNNVKLEKPYFLYDYVNPNDEMIFHYPVSYNGKIVYIIDAVKVDNVWNLSTSTDNVEFLNRINYSINEGNYIFYNDNDGVYAQSNLNYFYNGYSLNSWFLNLNEKKRTILKYVKNLKSLKAKDISIKRKEMYTPDFSIKMPSNTRLKLYKAKGQGTYGMCWAASCATIINYRNGSNVSAKEICDELEIGYDDGGDINDKQKALKNYGVTYSKKKNSVISWDSVKSNIDKKYPIAMSTFGKAGGHALTITGYQTIGSGRYLIIWDSAINSGKGTTRVVAYEGEKTSVIVNNEPFLWKKTLSKKS